MKKLLIFICCLFAFPMMSHAVKCTDEHSNEIRGLVSNVDIFYTIDTSKENPVFSIMINNLTDDMVVFDTVTNKGYKNFDVLGSQLKIDTTVTGNYNFDIYSFACKEKISSKSVNLPKYNIYYKDELCKGLENYPLCQKWSGYSSTRETFEKDIKKIKDDLAKLQKEEEKEEVVKKKWHEVVVDIFLSYWWLLGIVLVLLLVLYYYIRERKKKNEYDFSV